MLRRARASLAERHAVTLSVHGDFQAFGQVDREGGYAFGAYDNRFTRASRGTCIIVKHQGRRIGTYACALFDAHPSMAEVMEGPGLYFDGSDDHLRIEQPSARQWFEAMRGKVGFSGGIWVSRHYRGTDLSHTLVPTPNGLQCAQSVLQTTSESRLREPRGPEAHMHMCFPKQLVC